MKKAVRAFFLFAAFLVIVSSFPGISHALILKQPDIEKAKTSQSDAVKISDDAFRMAGYDINQLQLKETKATLVYNDSDQKNQWIVSHIVQDAVEPYYVTVIDATDGSIVLCARN